MWVKPPDVGFEGIGSGTQVSLVDSGFNLNVTLKVRAASHPLPQLLTDGSEPQINVINPNCASDRLVRSSAQADPPAFTLQSSVPTSTRSKRQATTRPSRMTGSAAAK